jgi:hypothetical protein
MCRGLRTVRTSTSSPFRSATGSFCYRAATGHRLRMEIATAHLAPHVHFAVQGDPYNWLLLRPRLWHKTCCFYKPFRLISLLPRDTRLCSHTALTMSRKINAEPLAEYAEDPPTCQLACRAHHAHCRGGGCICQCTEDKLHKPDVDHALGSIDALRTEIQRLSIPTGE